MSTILIKQSIQKINNNFTDDVPFAQYHEYLEGLKEEEEKYPDEVAYYKYHTQDGTNFSGLLSTFRMNDTTWDKWDYFIPTLVSSNVTDISYMLHDFWTSRKDINLTNWDVSNVTNMDYFINNQDINIVGWDTSKVKSMRYSFYGCSFTDNSVFIDTSNVEDMEGMFFKASIFGRVQDLDTSSCKNMNWMFCGVSFPSGYNLNNLDTSI